MIIWSWRGQSGDGNHNEYDEMNLRYFAQMERPEAKCPCIIFVYMTGHLKSGGAGHYGNGLIMEYCEVHNKRLFDFADIEIYDPDGIKR